MRRFTLPIFIVLIIVSTALSGCGVTITPVTGNIEGYVYYTDTAGRSIAERKLEVAPRLDVGDPLVAVAGASVSIPELGVQTTTNSNGYFRLTGLKSGTYELVVFHPDFRDPYVKDVTVVAGTTVSVGSVELGQGYFLTIGIGEYAYLKNLTAPPNDAIAMATFLEDTFHGNSESLLDGDATKSAIHNAISNIASKMTPNDFFILHFSGHGGGSLSTEPEFDYDFIAPTDYNWTEASAITDVDLRNWLMELPTEENIIVIIDACFSGSFIDGEYRTPTMSLRALSTLDCTVLCSATNTQLALEFDGLGAFSRGLIEGLSINKTGCDANNDYVITAQEWFDYAKDRAIEQVEDYNEAYGEDYVQTPVFQIDGNNPVILRY